MNNFITRASITGWAPYLSTHLVLYTARTPLPLSHPFLSLSLSDLALVVSALLCADAVCRRRVEMEGNDIFCKFCQVTCDASRYALLATAGSEDGAIMWPREGDC
jgi:hypothetical protein